MLPSIQNSKMYFILLDVFELQKYNEIVIQLQNTNYFSEGNKTEYTKYVKCI